MSDKIYSELPRNINTLENEKFTLSEDGLIEIRAGEGTGTVYTELPRNINTLEKEKFVLDDDGRVSIRLKSSGGGIVKYANLAAFPAVGKDTLLYLASDTGILYTWETTQYVAVSTTLALGETSTTAYRGDRGKTAYDHSQTTHDKAFVGLGSVDNTSDANKPVSTDQATAIGLKVTANTAITAGTKTKITYDAKGLVTGGSEAAIADITGLTDALNAKIAAPAVATDNSIARFDGTTGKIIKNSGIIIDDAGNLQFLGQSDIRSSTTEGHDLDLKIANSIGNIIYRDNADNIISRLFNDGTYVVGYTNNMAVGNHSPTAKLSIKGSGTTSATSSLLVKNSSDVELLRVRDDGTSVLKADTVINSVTVGKGQSSLTSNTAVGEMALNSVTTGDGNTAVGRLTLRFNTTGNNNVSIGNSALTSNIDGSNNVGLGLQALAACISGSGNMAIGANALVSNTGSNNVGIGTNSLFYNTSGTANVAIGTSAMTYNTTGSTNIAIGQSSLYSNIVGSYNIAIGYDSMPANLTNYNIGIGGSSLYSNTSGGSNMAIGYETLYSNVTGSSNLAIGFQALKANTGSYNLALGASSLTANTSGTYNIAIGEQAIRTNTTGYFNIGIGYTALYANIGGTDNTAIGAYSLRNNTSGVYNLAMGTNSLFTNVSGYFNLAIGYNSLYKNTGNNNIGVGAYALTNSTTGGGNLAVGYNSIQALATGSFNVGVGDQALSAITSGNYNVGLGVIAGNTLTSGDSNILIGYNTQAPTTTSSSTLNIGNLIYGDLTAAKKLGINNNAPTATLDIKGVGATSATSSLLVKNSSDVELLRVRDSGDVFMPAGLVTSKSGFKASNPDGSTDFTVNRSSTSYQNNYRFNTGGVENWAFGQDLTSVNDLYYYSYGGGGYTLYLTYTTGRVGINTTTPTAKLDINSDILRLRTAKTPSSATDTGNAGDMCWDASYVYVCTATNTWKRSAIATW